MTDQKVEVKKEPKEEDDSAASSTPDTNSAKSTPKKSSKKKDDDVKVSSDHQCMVRLEVSQRLESSISQSINHCNLTKSDLRPRA